MRNVLLVALTALCGCGEPSDAPSGAFVAMQEDFRGYAQWPAMDLGSTTLAGHPAGERRVFVHGGLTADGAAWATGTMLVKEIHVSANPRDWELFAMAKRGGGYNADGAAGWEFFILRLNAQNVPILVSRGFAPSDGTTDVYTGIGMGCNACHGLPDAQMFDSILTPSLRPRPVR